MSEIVICFDIDDTLVTNTVITNTLDKYGYSDVERLYTIEDMDIPEHVISEIYKGFSNPDIMGSFEPNKHAVEVVKLLKDVFDYRLISVTNRNESILGHCTRSMLGKLFDGRIKETYFTNGGSKLPFMLDHNVSVMIDDSQKVMIDCVGNCPTKLVLLTDENTSHNFKYAQSKPRDIHIIESLSHVFDIVNDLHKDSDKKLLSQMFTL